MGLFDFMSGGDGTPQYTPQQQQLAQSAGVDPMMVQQAQQQGTSNMLMQLGGTLLAAGQPGPLGSRGKILAQGLGNMQVPDINKSLLNSAQMQLYAQNLAEKKRDFALRQQAVQKIQGMDDLTDAQKTGALMDPVGFLKQQSASDLAVGQAKSVAQATVDQKVEQLVAAGMDPQRARALASGAIGEGKGMLGQTVLTDFRTTPMGGGGGIPTLGNMTGAGTAPAAGGAPAMTAGAGGTMPPRPMVGQTPTPAQTGTNMPVTDYSRAFGWGSGWKGAINDVTGRVTSGPEYPDVQQAETEARDLNQQIATTLPGATANGVRGNTTYGAKGISALLPEPGHILGSQSQAYDQYAAQAARIDDEIKNINNSPVTSAADISKNMSRLNELQTLRSRIGVVLNSWGQKGDGAAPQAAANSQAATQGQQIPMPEHRTVGQVYQTPKGAAKWMGSGWQMVQ